MKRKPRQIFFLAIKILISVALCVVLVAKLISEADKIDFNLYRSKFSDPAFTGFLLFSLLLMPLNWMLESLKWKMIVSSYLEKISFKTAFKSVFTGVAFGNLTPGRATEFAGKILFISEDNRVTATFLHFISGSAQLLVTILTGGYAMVALSFRLPMGPVLFYLFVLLLALLSCLLLLFLFNPEKAFRLFQKLKFFRKYAQGKIEIPRKVLLKLFLYSFIRHIVFTLQYFLIIKSFFGPGNDFYIFNGILLSWLLVSVIPMFSPVEAFMRGGIGILIFSPIESNSMNIFISSTLIWIINILLPSLFGLIFFLTRKTGKPS
jgi:uncharacterized membrane protein YbhN (UPF0104 family)